MARTVRLHPRIRARSTAGQFAPAMARATGCLARADLPELDGAVVRFLHAPYAARRNRAGVRLGSATCTLSRSYSRTKADLGKTQMGACPHRRCGGGCDGAGGRGLLLGVSLAAPF